MEFCQDFYPCQEIIQALSYAKAFFQKQETLSLVLGDEITVDMVNFMMTKQLCT